MYVVLLLREASVPVTVGLAAGVPPKKPSVAPEAASVTASWSALPRVIVPSLSESLVVCVWTVVPLPVAVGVLKIRLVTVELPVPAPGCSVTVDPTTSVPLASVP